MIALSRYELSLLLRSYRWIAPAVLFAFGVFALGGATLRHGAGLGPGLAWSALMLVPVEAWLTRSMLTAEPAAARACVCSDRGDAGWRRVRANRHRRAGNQVGRAEVSGDQRH